MLPKVELVINEFQLHQTVSFNNGFTFTPHSFFCLVRALKPFKDTYHLYAAFYGSLFSNIKGSAYLPDVNTKDKSGKTPLHTAVLSTQQRIVERLLECSADVTKTDDAGHTALHTAIRVGSESLVLVSMRAQPHPFFYNKI